jgi:Flp pilus assembly protein TadG
VKRDAPAPGASPNDSPRRSERGSVAAELAVALPAAVLVLLLGVGALGAAARQVALQDASADAARVLGRGEEEGRAAGIVRTAVPGARVSFGRSADLVCATATVDASIGSIIRVPLRASSCALDGGR